MNLLGLVTHENLITRYGIKLARNYKHEVCRDFNLDF